ASSLPGPLAAVVAWLPSAARGDALRALLAAGSGAVIVDAVVLLAWGAAGALIAARTFKWD
ncbi:MAG: ABC transporter permease, partial [Actinomycetota bacterium]